LGRLSPTTKIPFPAAALDPLYQIEQLARAAAESIQFRDQHHVAGVQRRYQPLRRPIASLMAPASTRRPCYVFCDFTEAV
jgi:hypothetical protein